MRKQTKSAIVKQICILLFSILVPFASLFSQSSDFGIEIISEPLINNAQIVELSTLINADGNSSVRLITIQITNFTEQEADDLYLDIDVFSSREGLLMESHQRNDVPFGLLPGQTASVSNIDLSMGRLPNTRNRVVFNGRLTSDGRALFNRLRGVTSLPADEYTIEVRLYQRNNSVNGGILVGSSSVTLGGNLIDSDLSIYLLSPGETVGSGVTISNPYPEFRWEGQQGQTYRLVLVEAVAGEDPQALLESAISTASSRGGAERLLEHEYLDVQVDGTSFSYPSFGTKSLQPGKRYYWQVYTELQTTSGVRERASEIWSFTMRDSRESVAGVEIDDELSELLISVIGAVKTERIIREGFSLFEIEIDGRVLSGEAAKEELLQLLDMMRNERIKLKD